MAEHVSERANVNTGDDVLKVPIWRTSAWSGEFADPYIGNTELEGGLPHRALHSYAHRLAEAVRDFGFVLGCTPDSPRGKQALELARKLTEAANASTDVELDRGFGEKPAMATPHSRGEKQNVALVIPAIKRHYAIVTSLRPGEYMIVDTGWRTTKGGHAVILVVERHVDAASTTTASDTGNSASPLTPGPTAEFLSGTASVTICNTGQGVQYHPADIGDYPKERYRTAMHIGPVPFWKLADDSFLFSLLRQRAIPDDSNGPLVLYDVLLPYLLGGPLAPAVDRATAEGKHGEWETPQRAGTCYFRALLCGVRYVLGRHYGWSAEEVKRCMAAVRLAYLAEGNRQLGRIHQAIKDGGELSRKALALAAKTSAAAVKDGGADGAKAGQANDEEKKGEEDRPFHKGELAEAADADRYIESALAFTESDAMLFELGCKQSARAVVKLHSKDRLGGQDVFDRAKATIEQAVALLRTVQSKLFGIIHDAIGVQLPELTDAASGPAENGRPPSTATQELEDEPAPVPVLAASASEAVLPLESSHHAGFGLLSHVGDDVTAFAGAVVESPPDLFVDLLPSDTAGNSSAGVVKDAVSDAAAGAGGSGNAPDGSAAGSGPAWTFARLSARLAELMQQCEALWRKMETSGLGLQKGSAGIYMLMMHIEGAVHHELPMPRPCPPRVEAERVSATGAQPAAAGHGSSEPHAAAMEGSKAYERGVARADYIASMRMLGVADGAADPWRSDEAGSGFSLAEQRAVLGHLYRLTQWYLLAMSCTPAAEEQYACRVLTVGALFAMFDAGVRAFPTVGDQVSPLTDAMDGLLTREAPEGVKDEDSSDEDEEDEEDEEAKDKAKNQSGKPSTDRSPGAEQAKPAGDAAQAGEAVAPAPSEPAAASADASHGAGGAASGAAPVAAASPAPADATADQRAEKAKDKPKEPQPSKTPKEKKKKGPPLPGFGFTLFSQSVSVGLDDLLSAYVVADPAMMKTRASLVAYERGINYHVDLPVPFTYLGASFRDSLGMVAQDPTFTLTGLLVDSTWREDAALPLTIYEGEVTPLQQMLLQAGPWRHAAWFAADQSSWADCPEFMQYRNLSLMYRLVAQYDSPLTLVQHGNRPSVANLADCEPDFEFEFMESSPAMLLMNMRWLRERVLPVGGLTKFNSHLAATLLCGVSKVTPKPREDDNAIGKSKDAKQKAKRRTAVLAAFTAEEDEDSDDDDEDGSGSGGDSEDGSGSGSDSGALKDNADEAAPGTDGKPNAKQRSSKKTPKDRSDPSQKLVLPRPKAHLDPLPCEDDVLLTSAEKLATYDDCLSIEDAERLHTILSGGLMTLPLLLQFFSGRRVGALLHSRLQAMLEERLSLPHSFGSKTGRPTVPDKKRAQAKHDQSRAGSEEDSYRRRARGRSRPSSEMDTEAADGRDGANVVDVAASPLDALDISPEHRAWLGGLFQDLGAVSQVPVHPAFRHTLGSPLGALLSELTTTPGIILSPLLQLCDSVLGLAVGDHTSPFVDLLLFIVRLAVRAEAYVLQAQQLLRETGKGRSEASSEDAFDPASLLAGYRADLRSLLTRRCLPLILEWLHQTEKAELLVRSAGFHGYVLLIYANATQEELCGYSSDSAPSSMVALAVLTSGYARILVAASYIHAWMDVAKVSTSKLNGMAHTPPTQNPTPASNRYGTSTPADKSKMVVPLDDVCRAYTTHRPELATWLEGLGSVTVSIDGHRPTSVTVGTTARDVLLQLVVATTLRKHVEDGQRFVHVAQARQRVEVAIESDHPYPHECDQYRKITIPGASSLSISFDARSSMESGHDYVRLCTDDTYSETYGSAMYTGAAAGPGMGYKSMHSPFGFVAAAGKRGRTAMGVYPGLHGKPPLVIPGNTVYIHFHSDKDVSDWGYKAIISCSVQEDFVQELVAGGWKGVFAVPALPSDATTIPAPEPEDVSALGPLPSDWAGLSLSRCMNDVTLARQWLRQHWQALTAGGADDPASPLYAPNRVQRGVYADRAGNIEVSLHLAEVYRRQRQTVPLPGEFSEHPDTYDVFKLGCTALASNKSQRKKGPEDEQRTEREASRHTEVIDLTRDDDDDDVVMMDHYGYGQGQPVNRNKADRCTLVAKMQGMQWVQMQRGGCVYDMQLWTNVSKTGASMLDDDVSAAMAQARALLDDNGPVSDWSPRDSYSEIDGTYLSHGLPRLVKLAPGTASGLDDASAGAASDAFGHTDGCFVFEGTLYTRVVKPPAVSHGVSPAVMRILGNVLSDAKLGVELDAEPFLWLRDGTALVPSVGAPTRFLMWLPAQGDPKTAKEALGYYYDIGVCVHPDAAGNAGLYGSTGILASSREAGVYVEVWQLVDHVRTAQKVLVYSSDSRRALRHLAPHVKDRWKPWPAGLLHAGGFAFGAAMTKKLKSEQMDVTGWGAVREDSLMAYGEDDNARQSPNARKAFGDETGLDACLHETLGISPSESSSMTSHQLSSMYASFSSSRKRLGTMRISRQVKVLVRRGVVPSPRATGAGTGPEHIRVGILDGTVTRSCTEVFVPHRLVVGLLPETICLGYELWLRVSPEDSGSSNEGQGLHDVTPGHVLPSRVVTIVGYPRAELPKAHHDGPEDRKDGAGVVLEYNSLGFAETQLLVLHIDARGHATVTVPERPGADREAATARAKALLQQQESNSDSSTEVQVDSCLVLLSAASAPAGSVLARLLAVLNRVEAASHMLLWGRRYRRCKDGVMAMDVDSAQPWDGVVLELVELTRLKQRFSVHVDLQQLSGTAITGEPGQGRATQPELQLVSLDFAGLRIASSLEPKVGQLLRQFPFVLPLQSSTGRYSLMAPSHGFRRPQVRSLPFTTVCAPIRDKAWLGVVDTGGGSRVHMYNVHPSGLFVVPQSQPAAAKLVLNLFALRKYAEGRAVLHLIEHSNGLGNEQRWHVSQMLLGLADDQHPDAVALRCRVILMLFASCVHKASSTTSKFNAANAAFSAYMSRSIGGDVFKLPEGYNPFSLLGYGDGDVSGLATELLTSLLPGYDKWEAMISMYHKYLTSLDHVHPSLLLSQEQEQVMITLCVYGAYVLQQNRRLDTFGSGMGPGRRRGQGPRDPDEHPIPAVIRRRDEYLAALQKAQAELPAELPSDPAAAAALPSKTADLPGFVRPGAGFGWQEIRRGYGIMLAREGTGAPDRYSAGLDDEKFMGLSGLERASLRIKAAQPRKPALPDFIRVHTQLLLANIKQAGHSSNDDIEDGYREDEGYYAYPHSLEMDTDEAAEQVKELQKRDPYEHRPEPMVGKSALHAAIRNELAALQSSDPDMFLGQSGSQRQSVPYPIRFLVWLQGGTQISVLQPAEMVQAGKGDAVVSASSSEQPGLPMHHPYWRAVALGDPTNPLRRSLLLAIQSYMRVIVPIFLQEFASLAAKIKKNKAAAAAAAAEESDSEDEENEHGGVSAFSGRGFGGWADEFDANDADVWEATKGGKGKKTSPSKGSKKDKKDKKKSKEPKEAEETAHSWTWSFMSTIASAVDMDISDATVAAAENGRRALTAIGPAVEPAVETYSNDHKSWEASVRAASTTVDAAVTAAQQVIKDVAKTMDYTADKAKRSDKDVEACRAKLRAATAALEAALPALPAVPAPVACAPLRSPRMDRLPRLLGVLASLHDRVMARSKELKLPRESCMVLYGEANFPVGDLQGKDKAKDKKDKGQSVSFGRPAKRSSGKAKTEDDEEASKAALEKAAASLKQAVSDEVTGVWRRLESELRGLVEDSDEERAWLPVPALPHVAVKTGVAADVEALEVKVCEVLRKLDTALLLSPTSQGRKAQEASTQAGKDEEAPALGTAPKGTHPVRLLYQSLTVPLLLCLLLLPTPMHQLLPPLPGYWLPALGGRSCMMKRHVSTSGMITNWPCIIRL